MQQEALILDTEMDKADILPLLSMTAEGRWTDSCLEAGKKGRNVLSHLTLPADN